jgi:hypothetical protein
MFDVAQGIDVEFAWGGRPKDRVAILRHRFELIVPALANSARRGS